MPNSAFRQVAATLFAIIAIAHGMRLLYSVPIQIGASDIPLWLSWFGLAIAAGLSVWGFRGRA